MIYKEDDENPDNNKTNKTQITVRPTESPSARGGIDGEREQPKLGCMCWRRACMRVCVAMCLRASAGEHEAELIKLLHFNYKI